MKKSQDSIHKIAKWKIPYDSLNFTRDSNNQNIKLGEGGYGIVYAGSYSGYTVAIKKLKTIGKFEDIKTEIKALQKTNNPNIVRFYGVSIHEDTIYMVMEYLPTGSLRSFLDKKQVQEVAWELRVKVATDIIEGLCYLHANKILHRDLKSDNVLLSAENRAKLCDLGLACQSKNISNLITIGMQSTHSLNLADSGVFGTPRWMAPEILVAEDLPVYSDKSDIYAYAITLWELASHALPFAGLAMYEIMHRIRKGKRLEEVSIPAEYTYYADLMKSAWQQDPQNRPSARELRECFYQNLAAINNSASAQPQQVAVNNTWNNEAIESPSNYNPSTPESLHNSTGCDLDLMSNSSINDLDQAEHDLKYPLISEECKNKRVGLKFVSDTQIINIREKLNLNEGHIIGTAINDGGCFFDSLAQTLNLYFNTQKHTEQSLRLACCVYVKKNAAEAIKLINSDKNSTLNILNYEEEMSKTGQDIEVPQWGRTEIEGVILCRQLNLDKFYIYEIDKDNDDVDYYGACEITKKGVKNIDWNEDNINMPCLVVKDLHFVPILTINPIANEDKCATLQTTSKRVHTHSTDKKQSLELKLELLKLEEAKVKAETAKLKAELEALKAQQGLEKLQPSRGPLMFSPSAVSSIIPTTTISSASTKPQTITPANLGEFLRLVVEGDQEQAEAMLKQNKNLALAAGNVTDLSERTFNNITGFQYAVWALDWHMWSMLRKYLSAEEIRMQLKSMLRGSWVAEHDKAVSWKNLINALNDCINLCKQSNWHGANTKWIKDVGSSQILLPVHVINEYCNPNRPFYPCPDFKDLTPLPRTRNIDNKDEWFTSTYSNGKCGETFAFYKSIYSGSARVSIGMAWFSWEWKWVSYHIHDHIAVKTLLDIRMQQSEQLFTEFLIDQEEQGIDYKMALP